MEDYAIGEEFCHEGVMLRVVEDVSNKISCEGCYFVHGNTCWTIPCSDGERADRENVIFEKVEAQ